MNQQLQDLKRFIIKSDFEYIWNPPCTEKEILSFEDLNKVKFPEPIRSNYLGVNGFTIFEPHFELFSLDNVTFENSRLVFGRFNKKHCVYFKTDVINQAKQWDVFALENDFLVTHSMNSLIVNRIPAWVGRNRKIWDDE